MSVTSTDTHTKKDDCYAFTNFTYLAVSAVCYHAVCRCSRSDPSKKETGNSSDTSSNTIQTSTETDQTQESELPMVNLPQDTPEKDASDQRPNPSQGTDPSQQPVNDPQMPSDTTQSEDGTIELPLVPAS